jgi:type IV secretion system protein TrbC
MNESRRTSPPADLLLIFRPLRSEDQAPRLARASGWLLMLAGVIVVLLGFLLNHPPTMIEGTLVTLLALIAGWVRSRLAATLLLLLLALGLAGGLAGGIEPATIVFLLIALLTSLRLLEATFRFRWPHVDH